MGNTDEPPVVNVDPKDWFKKPERPPTPDPEWNESKTVDNKPTQKWLSDLAKAEKSSKIFDDLMITPINFIAFVMNRLQISDLPQDILVGPAYKILKGTCRSYVELKYNMEECYKALTDQLDWNNLEGGSTSRAYTTSLTKKKAAQYDLQGIKDMDMPLLVVQNRLFNLEGDIIVHLAAALRVIYLDMFERNRLMCSHELYKFSDGTLISVRDKLKDMANNLEMGYTIVMPRRRWSNLDKKWSRIIKKYIDR
ncbi:hypothetical protein Tco_0884599 [Tanacetum coccineum]